jgi:hypothetical protein
MTDDYINEFTDNLAKKLGDEQNAIIADDLGTLITKNAETQRQLKAQQDEVERLKSLNEKLVITNGNLLKQVPSEKSVNKSSDEQETVSTKIDLKSAFDANGNFIR